MIRTTLAALLASASVASAGGYVAPITDAPPVPRPAQASKPTHDWTGAYVGLSYGTQRTKSQRATYEDRELTETRPVYEDRPITEVRRETRPYTKLDLHHDLQATGCEHPGSKFELTNGSTIGTVPCASVLNAQPNDSWSDWAIVGHAPVIVREWTEVTGSETVHVGSETTVTGHETVQTGTETIRSTDSTAGVFAGYRHQLVGGTVWGVEASYSRVGGEDSTRLMAQGGYSLGRVLPYLTAGFDLSQDAPVYGAGIDVALTRRLLGGLAYTRADDAERIEARAAWRW
ncbi:MAG TPA: hypothetical protein VL027_01865 [Spongiibacteraceae bacterium]|nr:hypothetical protein [Spongiibacteraceae bacterium]